MPKKADFQPMVGAIREAGRPVTSTDIADDASVSRQTVNNYKDKIMDHPKVVSDVIGGTRVYWHVEQGLPPNSEDILLVEGEIAREVQEEAEQADVDVSEAARELVEIGLEKAALEDEDDDGQTYTRVERAQSQSARVATFWAQLLILFGGAQLLSPSGLVGTLAVISLAVAVGATVAWGLATLALRSAGPDTNPLMALKRRLT